MFYAYVIYCDAHMLRCRLHAEYPALKPICHGNRRARRRRALPRNMEQNSIPLERTKVLDIVVKIVNLITDLMTIFGLR